MGLKASEEMECRRCGACCEALSISSEIPGMPEGKPAGVRCIHLTHEGLCSLFGLPSRPPVCSDFKPSPETCGRSRKEALQLMGRMERETSPGSGCANGEDGTRLEY
jgi:hypothetical protein